MHHAVARACLQDRTHEEDDEDTKRFCELLLGSQRPQMLNKTTLTDAMGASNRRAAERRLFQMAAALVLGSQVWLGSLFSHLLVAARRG